MKGRAIAYSAEELAWLRERREWPRAVLHDVFGLLFDRRDVSLGALNGLMKRKGWMTGRDGKITKGARSWNTGLKGWTPPGSERTRLKKGNRTGRANHLYQPIGTERLNQDGYRERKIHDGQPMHSRWRLVHLVEWEAVNGPIPKGMCLKCLDGDRLNTDPANWQAIPRAILPRLNGGRHKKRLAYDDASPEVRPAILTVAKVEHAAREAQAERAAA